MNWDHVRAALKLDGVDDATIEAFFAYHAKNPDVWKWFERFTFELIKAGKRRGAKAIAERIRYEADIKGYQNFKLNNIYVAYYSRVFGIKHRSYSHYFKKRKVTGLRMAA